MDETPKLPSTDVPLVPPSGQHDLAGTTLAGYRLVRKIAQGGMGIIYEAIQIKLDRKVALKVLTEPLQGRPEFFQRFEREAKAAAALNHPNVVQVHDFGEADGRHFIIMEYIEGQNLSAYVAIRGKLPVAEALDLIEQAARALKAAAEKSIIHRDIKPSNLMLTRSGVVKVADLGLAKVLTQDSELTMSNIVGSPHFIAPEQATDSRNIDHRADIYSLGLTLFFLLTATYPYDGNSPISIVLAHQKPLPSAAELGIDLPAEVETLVQRMAAKNPNDRYQDYDSLIADLQRVKAGYAPALPPLPTSTPQPATKPMGLIIGISVGALVLIVAMAAIIVVLSKKPSPDKTIVAQTTPSSAAPVAANTRPLSPLEARRTEPQPPGNNFGPPQQDQLPPDQQGPPGGDNRPPWPMPMGPPPRMPDINAIPDGPPETMLTAANDYAAKNPTEYMNILARYRQVQQRAAGTPAGRDVDDKIQQWSAAQNQAANDAIKQFDTKMRAALAASGAQAAYNVWKDFPSNLRSRETDNQIVKVLQQVLPSDFRPSGPGRIPQP